VVQVVGPGGGWPASPCLHVKDHLALCIVHSPALQHRRRRHNGQSYLPAQRPRQEGEGYRLLAHVRAVAVATPLPSDMTCPLTPRQLPPPVHRQDHPRRRGLQLGAHGCRARSDHRLGLLHGEWRADLGAAQGTGKKRVFSGWSVAPRLRGVAKRGVASMGDMQFAVLCITYRGFPLTSPPAVVSSPTTSPRPAPARSSVSPSTRNGRSSVPSTLVPTG
jgi:hypothetical protein